MSSSTIVSDYTIEEYICYRLNVRRFDINTGELGPMPFRIYIENEHYFIKLKNKRYKIPKYLADTIPQHFVGRETFKIDDIKNLSMDMEFCGYDEAINNISSNDFKNTHENVFREFMKAYDTYHKNNIWNDIKKGKYEEKHTYKDDYNVFKDAKIDESVSVSLYLLGFKSIDTANARNLLNEDIDRIKLLVDDQLKDDHDILSKMSDIIKCNGFNEISNVNFNEWFARIEPSTPNDPYSLKLCFNLPAVNNISAIVKYKGSNDVKIANQILLYKSSKQSKHKNKQGDWNIFFGASSYAKLYNEVEYKEKCDLMKHIRKNLLKM